MMRPPPAPVLGPPPPDPTAKSKETVKDLKGPNKNEVYRLTPETLPRPINNTMCCQSTMMTTTLTMAPTLANSHVLPLWVSYEPMPRGCLRGMESILRMGQITPLRCPRCEAYMTAYCDIQTTSLYEFDYTCSFCSEHFHVSDPSMAHTKMFDGQTKAFGTYQCLEYDLARNGDPVYGDPLLEGFPDLQQEDEPVPVCLVVDRSVVDRVGEWLERNLCPRSDGTGGEGENPETLAKAGLGGASSRYRHKRGGRGSRRRFEMRSSADSVESFSFRESSSGSYSGSGSWEDESSNTCSDSCSPDESDVPRMEDNIILPPPQDVNAGPSGPRVVDAYYEHTCSPLSTDSAGANAVQQVRTGDAGAKPLIEVYLTEGATSSTAAPTSSSDSSSDDQAPPVTVNDPYAQLQQSAPSASRYSSSSYSDDSTLGNIGPSGMTSSTSTPAPTQAGGNQQDAAAAPEATSSQRRKNRSAEDKSKSPPLKYVPGKCYYQGVRVMLVVYDSQS
ncbi:unnamed protein product, partial [Amoebophrya sp. A25]|eukprot:GSA25T00011766001.1